VAPSVVRYLKLERR